MELRWPSEAELPGYIDAIERGWSPNTIDADAGLGELAQLRQDPSGFLASLVDREATGAPIPLPDGSVMSATASYRGSAGGMLVERFAYPPAHGKGDGLRYRIDVTFGV
jgi:hypothetical protein